MKVYIAVDYEELKNMQVFSNKSDAEDYMLDYIFEHYTEKVPPREELKARILRTGFFETISIIEKEVI